ncbi:Gliding motility-associated ABC transporter ATP-binding protein GldA [hydrothermal vent metagenome]|uniref:Gliding motility-associated ABC transporter ATP-binding protein GldA n=1 Tax=hydrothermal vent metagenome TaxID=652676 RepID=A0A3B1D1J1_9ZZZZ
MIEVKNLTKTYGGARGIDDISFNVNKGEVLGFLGPNGAGKTTTMRILTCFMPATSGSAMVAGYDVFEDSLNVRKRIGYLPETVPLYLDMQVPVYLRFVAGLKDVPLRKIKSKVGEIMEQVGLTHMSHKLIGELSKGYRQRVGLAQVLINDPEVLILDEPTIGLDPKQIIEIRTLIKGLGGDRTIILSSHILPEVSMLCERVVIIDEGRVKAMDTPENLTHRLNAASRVKARISGPDKSVVEALKRIDGVASVETLQDGNESAKSYLVEFTDGFNGAHLVARAASDSKWDLYELTPMKMTLEDIFIRIVMEEETNQ